MRAIRMPKEDPAWRFALGASPVSEGFLVSLEGEDGSAGYGWASVLEHLGHGARSVEADLSRLIGTLDGEDTEQAFALLDGVRVVNPAQAAAETALYDLVATSRRLPLYRLFGPRVRDRVAILRILALKTPAETAEIARRLLAEGDRHLKIKLDGDGPLDIARVRAVREAVGPDVVITVDANQSYRSAHEAITAIEEMERERIALVEQPLPVGDDAGMAEVARAVDTPVEADEAAQTLDDIRRLADHRVVDAVSLKVPKLGGLRRTREAAVLCREAGLQCRIGAHVGSRVLAAAALHVAAASPEVSDVAELGEFARLRDDPAEGIEVEGGMLRVPEGPGLGVRLRVATVQ